ncbi:recombination protein NinG [Ursidibacter arcticus]
MEKKNKPPKQHKCKVCGDYYVKFQSTQQVCSVKCAMVMGKRKSEHTRKKQEQSDRLAERKRIKALKEKVKTRDEWLKEAQAVFNKFIRLRDKDLPCISCQRFHQGQYHAGHYRTVKAMPELRFNEDNVHKQCSACNNHLSGNITEYRIHLVRKIGVDKVEWLEGHHTAVKWSIEDCKRIIAEYKAKIKEIEGGR